MTRAAGRNVKTNRYWTFTGRVYEAGFPVAGFIGVAGNFLENIFDNHVTWATWFIPFFLVAFAVFSWRGIFSGILVKGDTISNRGLFRTRAFLLKDVNNVNASGSVVPLLGPNLFRNDIGVVLSIRGGNEVDCPAVYGSSKKVDKIIAEIRQQVKEAKKKRP